MFIRFRAAVRLEFASFHSGFPDAIGELLSFGLHTMRTLLSAASETSSPSARETLRQEDLRLVILNASSLVTLTFSKTML